MKPRIRTESAARTDVGRVRKINEDNFLERSEAGLWVVADGMGGHQAGDLASAMIVETIREVDSFGSGYALVADVRDRIERVNRDLMVRASALDAGATIGSTVVILVVYEDHYACLWAGDSRIYLLRDNRLEQLTRDHSILQELLDAGTLAAKDASSFRKSNVITRAVGVADPLALDMRHGLVRSDDVFLLCSDGLTGTLSDAEIEKIVAAASSLEAGADALIARTLESGARDNVTVVLVRAVPDPDDTLNAPARDGW